MTKTRSPKTKKTKSHAEEPRSAPTSATTPSAPELAVGGSIDTFGAHQDEYRQANPDPDAINYALAPAGSILGWTFWSTWAMCKWKFLLRYIAGVVPLEPKSYLVLGTTYHAIMEGLSEKEIAKWGKRYVEAIPMAKSLALARMSGPPIPESIHRERTVRVPGANMTSKPDREEYDWDRREVTVGAGHPAPTYPRDFKTAGWSKDSDQASWDVSGTMMGQMIATGSSHAVVDVINKTTHRTHLFPVTMTETKKRTFLLFMQDLVEQLEERLKGHYAYHPLESRFPRNFTSCADSRYKCEFYERCWGDRKAQLSFTVREVRPWWEALKIAKKHVKVVAKAFKESGL